MLSRFSSGRIAAGLLVLGLAGGLALPATAQTVAPQQQTQVPGYYRMNLGKIQVTALFDGAISLDPKLLKGVSADDVQSLMARMFQESAKGMQTAVNAFLVHTGDTLVLIDTGAANCFGPALGNIGANLQAAGYQPADVNAVLLTHLHPDHACGLRTNDGAAAFPNADVYAAKAEADFWLNAETMAGAPKEAQPFFQMAMDAVKPYGDRFKTFAPGDVLFTSLTTVASTGHTPGHTSYKVSAGDESLLVWGDIVHNFATQFPRPEIAIEFDTDNAAAIATRKKLFAEAAAEKLWIGGAHMPFPGIGHVRQEGDGYAWVPVEFAPLAAQQ